MVRNFFFENFFEEKIFYFFLQTWPVTGEGVSLFRTEPAPILISQNDVFDASNRIKC